MYRVPDRRDVFLKKGGRKMFMALEIPINDTCLSDTQFFHSLVFGKNTVIPATWTIHTKGMKTSEEIAEMQKRVCAENATHCAVGIETAGNWIDGIKTHTVFVCYE